MTDMDDINFQSHDDDDGEWGFCVQLEQDDGEGDEMKHSHQLLVPTSPKAGIKISVKQTVTRGLSTSDSETSLAAPTFPRIKSNSSFQELERAIGATLAMSFPGDDVTDISAHVKVINHINGVITQKASLKKNLQQQRPIMRHRLGDHEVHKREVEKIDDYPMRAELMPFLEETESRALVIFHSRDIIAFDIKSASQMFGSLYYFRSDFHSCGVTLLAYFDLRSAIDAKEKLSSRLGRLAKATVYASIMLQPSASCRECSLRIHRVLNTKSEAYVHKIFSNYGPLRSIQRSFNDSGVIGTLTATPEGDSNCDYTAEYYNIQDAKLAAAEMNSSPQNVLGAEVVFVPLEKRVERLKSALLSTLSAWRIRMTEEEVVTCAGSEGNQRQVKPEKLPIPTSDMERIVEFEGAGISAAHAATGSGIGGLSGGGSGGGDASSAPPPPQDPAPVPPAEPLSVSNPTNKHSHPRYPTHRGGVDQQEGGGHLGGGHPMYPPQQRVEGYVSFPYHRAPHEYGHSGYAPHAAGTAGVHSMIMNGYMGYPGAPPHLQHMQHPQANMYGGGMSMSMHPQHMHGGYGQGGYMATAVAAQSFQFQQQQQPQQFHYSQQHFQQQPLQVQQQFQNTPTTRPPKRNGSHGNSSTGQSQSRPPHHNGGHGKRSGGGQPGQGQSQGQGQGQAVRAQSCQEDRNLPLTPRHLLDDRENRTTVMIRNIPNKYTQSMLLEEVNRNYEGQYDFFYLPIDFHNKCNVGYGFINFVDSSDVARFFDEFNDQRWRNFNSDKVCALSYARIQGKAAMIARFQKSTLLLKDDSYKPLLFVSKGERKGQPEPFLPAVGASASSSVAPAAPASDDSSGAGAGAGAGAGC